MLRRAIAVGSLTTVQSASGDRFLSHRYRRALRQEIPLKSDQQLRKTIDDLRELERKCFASRSRFAFYDYLAAVFELYVQLRRTKQAKQSAKSIAKLFRLRKQDRTPPHQGDHRCDLDGGPQDQKPLDPGLAVHLARTQNMEGFENVPAGERRACGVRRSVCSDQKKASAVYRLPVCRNWAAVSDSPQSRFYWQPIVTPLFLALWMTHGVEQHTRPFQI